MDVSFADPEAMSRRKNIAVVIPAFKVAERIGSVIAEVPAAVMHIIVVDDASPDTSGDRARVAADPRVEVIRHEHNFGVGAATLTGYRRARELGADIVVKIDGDGQMDLTYLSELIEPILEGDADYTKGNRFLHGSALKQMPLRRRLGNLGLSFLTKAASGYWDMFDPTNGYTAIDARVLDLLDESSIDRRWYFETSMLIALGRIGAVVRDVSIPARYGQEKSSLSEASAFVRFPPRLLSALLQRIWLTYFVRDFSPLALFLITGVPLLLFGLFWGVYHWSASAKTGVEASTGTVMIAVLPLILGTQLLIQAFVIDIQGPRRAPLGTTRRRR
jgi:dolichol-phosphate mannosyltransferase